MIRIMRLLASWRESVRLAAGALRLWGPRQVLVAASAAIVVALAIGIATVLIPNPVFTRDIPPVWWNYPVWLLTSALMGALIATYVRPATTHGATGAGPGSAAGDESETRSERGSARAGGAASILAWFAVGCPVCNKIALFALGYGGALTWFAPLQPFLAATALVLSVIALVWRLRGQVACPLPAVGQRSEAVAR